MDKQAQRNNEWFTADQHFGHDNIIRYCERPFACVADMNHALIDNWNSMVAPGDTVYCLGDFFLGKFAQQYFTQLQGHIYVVPGGHDKRWLKKGPYYSVNNHRVEILPPLYALHALQGAGLLKIQRVVLCHYPIENWEGKHHGAWHLHGHSHGRSSLMPGRIDVGVDCHNFFPISLEEVEEIMNTN